MSVQPGLFESVHYIEGGLDALPKTAAEAEAIGSSYFFTGKPCPRGHVFMRYTKGGRCSYCQREKNAEKNGRKFVPELSYAARYMKRMEALKSNSKTYVPAKPCKHGHMLRFTGSNNCVECDAKVRKTHRKASQYARIKKLYGLSRDKYHVLVDSQDSKCAICAKHFKNNFNLHIDHCHTTGKVRGLLCNKCNQAIGLFGENVAKMRLAIEYLVNHGA